MQKTFRYSKASLLDDQLCEQIETEYAHARFSEKIWIYNRLIKQFDAMVWLNLPETTVERIFGDDNWKLTITD